MHALGRERQFVWKTIQPADYESDTLWDDVPLNSAENKKMGLLL